MNSTPTDYSSRCYDFLSNRRKGPGIKLRESYADGNTLKFESQRSSVNKSGDLQGQKETANLSG